MAQSTSLADFFERFGGVDDLAWEVFPIPLGRYGLELAGFRLAPDAETGDDTLVGTFRLVERNATGTEIVRILEQDVQLLDLPAAVAEDVYRVHGIRIWIAPETVKLRLKRFLEGLARGARARYPALEGAPDIKPSDLL